MLDPTSAEVLEQLNGACRYQFPDRPPHPAFDAAKVLIERLEKENFALAANQCHAGYGDDYGNHRCEKIDGLKDALLGLIEAIELDSDKGGKGISGYTAARLTDARAALAASVLQCLSTQKDRQ